MSARGMQADYKCEDSAGNGRKGLDKNKPQYLWECKICVEMKGYLKT